MADCFDLLKQGVYAKHNIAYSTNHSEDFKHYLESDEFRNDFLNNNQGLDIEVVIYGVPITLGYNSDETEIKEFQKKVKESTEFKVNDNFFYSLADSYADKTLIDAFVQCINANSLGFVINSYTTDDTITFKVTYNNYGGLESPVLKDVYLSSGSKLLHQTLQIGEKLENNQQASFTFELDKNKKEILFVINTNLSSQTEKVTISKKGISNDASPIGTIVSSFLNWEQFVKATDNNKFSGSIWNSENSFWSPCDGREVPNSSFESLANIKNVPDLRGVFLRGLNAFDNNENSNRIKPVSDSQKDPQIGRFSGSFQMDALQNLTGHINGIKSDNRGFGSDGIFTSTGYIGDGDGGENRGAFNVSFNAGNVARVADETRPKNVAIFYYIRIN